MSLHYRSYSDYLKEQFPGRVFKIPIDAGFSCPNIDGTVASGGCAYCDNRSFSPNSRLMPRPLREQVIDGIAFYRERYRAEKFIVYFQAFTNTHAPVERLRHLYDEALACPDVAGLAIGTRPDCVPEPVLDLLAEYRAKTHLWVEYGLQSIHDETLAPLNRAHGQAAFLDAVARTRPRGIPICAHVILGLPGESREMMMRTAEEVARLDLDAVKIHHLYIARNTALEKQYRERPFPMLELEDYVRLVCDFIERMPPRMVIERLMGELSPEHVVAPQWERSKGKILAMIDREFDRRGTRQGSRRPLTVAG